MQRSIIDRFFPPSGSTRWQPDHDILYRDVDSSQPTIPARRNSITTAESKNSSATSFTRSGKSKIGPPTVVTSYQEDPFLDVDRAARNLQDTIRSLLDLQAQILDDRQGSNTQIHDNLTLAAETVDTRSNSVSSSVGVKPVRQPNLRTPTLKSIRDDLLRSTHALVRTKQEDVRITQEQMRQRDQALSRIHTLQRQESAVKQQLGIVRTELDAAASSALCLEAQNVEHEIRALEDRLMELRARHRHLIIKAEESKNVAESRISSYKGTLQHVERETRSFLRNPPITSRLVSGQVDDNLNFYVLEASRRTLSMAQEQWIKECEALNDHESDLKLEIERLEESSSSCRQGFELIEHFERQLRAHIKTARIEDKSGSSARQDPFGGVTPLLESTIRALHEIIAGAVAKDHHLVIAALGIEEEALQQARLLITGDVIQYEQMNNRSISTSESVVAAASTTSPTVLLQDLDIKPESNYQEILDLHAESVDQGSSNESLKATLCNLSDQHGLQSNVNHRRSVVQQHSSESEDDDPGPDLLVSQ